MRYWTYPITKSLYTSRPSSHRRPEGGGRLDATAVRRHGGPAYAKADAGKDINFMVVHKPAVIQFPKHIAPKIVTPEVNQTSDGYKFGYRQVAIADVYENKVAGVYLHHKA